MTGRLALFGWRTARHVPWDTRTSTDVTNESCVLGNTPFNLIMTDRVHIAATGKALS